MISHCKGCKFHHNAGHKYDSVNAKKYNDWCCKYGKTATKSVGQCKLLNGKESSTDD